MARRRHGTGNRTAWASRSAMDHELREAGRSAGRGYHFLLFLSRPTAGRCRRARRHGVLHAARHRAAARRTPRRASSSATAAASITSRRTGCSKW
eukprot:357473-Chlamydomonas_euryale.AAC.14